MRILFVEDDLEQLEPLAIALSQEVMLSMPLKTGKQPNG